MKAARLYAPFDLRIDEMAPPPSPPDDWVVLRVTAAGICGSDIHNYKTGQWIGDRTAVAGHEFAGLVTAIGPRVEMLAVGDRVVADSRFWCGKCRRCKRGSMHLCEHLGFVGEVCDGGFSEMTALPARLLLKVDASVTDEVAAMAEPLAVALHAVRRLAPPPGAPVLIVGCGTIGALAALVLSREPDRAVLVADRSKERVQLVTAATGATPASLVFEDWPDEFRDRSIGHVIDATGSVAALEALVRSVEPGTTIAVVGIGHGTFPFDPNLLVERELTLIGCHAFVDELPRAIELLPSLGSELSKFIGRRIALAELPSAYAALVDGTAPGLKTMVTNFSA